MEHKIGTILTHEKHHYIVKEEIRGCEGCAFHDINNEECHISETKMGECSWVRRKDKKGIIFIEKKRNMKRRILITIDPELHDWLKSFNINVSSYINSLINHNKKEWERKQLKLD